MTANRLISAAQRQTAIGPSRRDFPSDQAWCDYRNSAMDRDDVEWVVVPSGGYRLQYRQSPKALKAELEAKAERERRDFNHRQAYPITA